jgi:hypothetical protein
MGTALNLGKPPNVHELKEVVMKKSFHILVPSTVFLAILTFACPATAINPYATESSTGAMLRGQADVVKAQAAIVTAQASVLTNVAATNAALAKARDDLERVRAMALDNDLKAAKAFYDRRKMYADYQAQRAAQRGKSDVARRGRPTTERASVYEVDPLRGRIFWPSVLKREEFADARVQMDALFADRKARQAGLGSNFCRQAKMLTGEMRDQLREMVDDLSPAEYVAARKFLDTLSFEAQMPPRIEGMAAK